MQDAAIIIIGFIITIGALYAAARIFDRPVKPVKRPTPAVMVCERSARALQSRRVYTDGRAMYDASKQRPCGAYALRKGAA